MTPEPPGEVRAAGGVVVRDRDGRREVAVVHRPKYDDWSLPKGKLHADEDWREAALREVAEETGLRCEPLAELRPSRYLDSKGRRKLVRWWLMRSLDGEFQSSHEVDEVRWAPLEEAGDLLDYARDRDLVASVAGGSPGPAD